MPHRLEDDEDEDEDGSYEARSEADRLKRTLQGVEDGDEESLEAKRRRILEATRDIDADDDSEADDDSDEDDSDEDDDEAELQRELERVRREREDRKRKEEEEKAKAESEASERGAAMGNPLLNKQDFNMKRRWDDDVVFKNQARGTEERGKKKEFVNVSSARFALAFVTS